jgi:predicted nuclease of predicted toxin-antitoxin system
MKVRFLADADLNKAIVTGVLRREPSVDFLTAQAAGLRGMKDPAVLALAAQQQRVLVSHDAGTMPHHFRKFREGGSPCSGIFLIPQSLDIGTAIEELLIIWLVSEAAEWNNRMEWLPL